MTMQIHLSYVLEDYTLSKWVSGEGNGFRKHMGLEAVK